MTYRIKGKRGLYAGHRLKPSFRRKQKMEEVVDFQTFAEAKKILDNPKAYPEMEECVIEPKG